jgi:hypothetical protein
MRILVSRRSRRTPDNLLCSLRTLLKRTTQCVSTAIGTSGVTIIYVVSNTSRVSFAKTANIKDNTHLFSCNEIRVH